MKKYKKFMICDYLGIHYDYLRKHPINWEYVYKVLNSSLSTRDKKTHIYSNGS